MVFAVVGAVVVVVVGLVAVGGAVGRLRIEPPRNVFEHDEALEFVAQALPAELTAELSYEEVQRIMRLHLDYLHAEGVARSGGDLPSSGRARRSSTPRTRVRYVLRRAALVDFFPKADAVRRVVDAQLAYFEAIGAIAPVTEPELAELQDPAARDAPAGGAAVEPPPS